MKIAVITATRAEYGILTPLLNELKRDPEIQLQLCVTGTHLSAEFGHTISQIEADKFEVSKKIEILLSSDSRVAVAKSAGLATLSFADALDDLRPDYVLLLGDRYEMLAIAMSAHLLNIPIAHIHGGEKTVGSLDDSTRHAISKLSSLHFVSCELHRKRLLQLGEDSATIFNVGAPSLESILGLNLVSKSELFDELGLSEAKKTILFTFHPETNIEASVETQLSEIFSAIDSIECDVQVLMTKANADFQGRHINEILKKKVEKNPSKYILRDSLGRLRFFSMLSCADLIFGNSSSGIIEAPSFSIPTLNVGERQKGRQSAKSVYHSPIEKIAMAKQINQIFSRQFTEIDFVNPYQPKDKPSTRMVTELKKAKTKTNIKDFVDL